MTRALVLTSLKHDLATNRFAAAFSDGSVSITVEAEGASFIGATTSDIENVALEKCESIARDLLERLPRFKKFG